MTIKTFLCENECDDEPGGNPMNEFCVKKVLFSLKFLDSGLLHLLGFIFAVFDFQTNLVFFRTKIPL